MTTKTRSTRRAGATKAAATKPASPAAEVKETSAAPTESIPTQSVGKHDHDRRVQSVKEFAQAHYEESGWDVVVETMDDDAIYEIVKRTQTEKGAIEKMAAHLAPYAAHRDDIAGA